MIQASPTVTEELMCETYGNSSGSSQPAMRAGNLALPRQSAAGRQGSKKRVYSLGSTSDPQGKRETRLTPPLAVRSSTQKRVVQGLKASKDDGSFELLARQAERSRTLPVARGARKGMVGVRWAIGVGMIGLVVLFGFIRLSGSSERAEPDLSMPAQKAALPGGLQEAKQEPVAHAGPAVSTPEKEAEAAPAESQTKTKPQLVAQAKTKPAKGKKALHRKKAGKRLARAHRGRG